MYVSVCGLAFSFYCNVKMYIYILFNDVDTAKLLINVWVVHFFYKINAPLLISPKNILLLYNKWIGKKQTKKTNKKTHNTFRIFFAKYLNHNKLFTVFGKKTNFAPNQTDSSVEVDKSHIKHKIYRM